MITFYEDSFLRLLQKSWFYHVRNSIRKIHQFDLR